MSEQLMKTKHITKFKYHGISFEVAINSIHVMKCENCGMIQRLHNKKGRCPIITLGSEKLRIRKR